jgi:hypothetical protein
LVTLGESIEAFVDRGHHKYDTPGLERCRRGR